MQRSPKCQECDNDSIAIWVEPGIADRRYLCVECTCRYVRAALPRGYLLGIQTMDRATALAVPEPGPVQDDTNPADPQHPELPYRDTDGTPTGGFVGGTQNP